MGRAANGRRVRAPSLPAMTDVVGGSAPAGVESTDRAAGAGRGGEGRRMPVPPAGGPEVEGGESPHVLQCALTMVGTIHDPETGRPLGELLRKIGYL